MTVMMSDVSNCAADSEAKPRDDVQSSNERLSHADRRSALRPSVAPAGALARIIPLARSGPEAPIDNARMRILRVFTIPQKNSRIFFTEF